MPNSLTIKPSDLVILGFKYSRETHAGKFFTGHKLRVTISDRHIRIQMQSCSCALVQTNEYSLENMKNLLDGLKINNDAES